MQSDAIAITAACFKAAIIMVTVNQRRRKKENCGREVCNGTWYSQYCVLVMHRNFPNQYHHGGNSPSPKPQYDLTL